MLPIASKKIEVIANVAIIVVACLLSIVLIKLYLLNDGPKRPKSPVHTLVGSKPSLPGIEWEKNGRTLLLVLQRGCHFCAESAPFYQRLVSDAAGHREMKIVALLPQQVEESKQYLKDLGVEVSEVLQVWPKQLGVDGTPTLLLVNNAGVVTDYWVGKLNANKEAEVLHRLKS